MVLTVTPIWSTENCVDLLTCIPEEWMQSVWLAVGTAAVNKQDTAINSIADVHMHTGHSSIQHIFSWPGTSLKVKWAEAYKTVGQCGACWTIDPMRWQHKSLSDGYMVVFGYRRHSSPWLCLFPQHRHT